MSGSVSAPYWGHLPSQHRRASQDDYTSHEEHWRQPLEEEPTPPRAHRASGQTQTSIDSTYSPLTTPVTSSFVGAGLAPRPPSFSYGQEDHPPPESADKRRRRSARNHEDLTDDVARATPPAAPEVPRAPPISYNPYGSGRGSPYTFNAAGEPGPPPSAHRSIAQARATAGMEVDAASVSRQLDEELEARRARRAMNGPELIDIGRAGSSRNPSNGDRPDRAPSSRRKDSLDPDAHRKPWAYDRSPLQKLELTLDSITKEEKRARVEAAERRLREKNAAAAVAVAPADVDYISAEADRPVVQQVRFRDRRPPVAQAPAQGEAQRPTTSHGPPMQPQLATAPAQRASAAPASRLPMPKNRSVSAEVRAEPKADLPQRNLSFRERAGKNEVSAASGGEDMSPHDSPSIPSGAVGVGRSASNKLRKNPPGDPWYSKRVEAEERYASISRPGEDLPPPQPSQPSQPPLPPPQARPAGVSRSFSAGATLKKPPPQRTEPERSLPRGNQYDDYVYDDYEEEPRSRARGFAAAIGLGRSASLGSKAHPPPPASHETPTRAPGDRSKSVKFPGHVDDDSEAADGHHQHHHLKDYFHREKLQPGQGMYKPTVYLDEWKKAPVGTLSGALLDITAEVPAPPEEKDSAWWETPPSKRRGSTSARPSKAEAYEGEYDDTLAPTRFKPPLYLKCGPLLRYCGIRRESAPARSRSSTATDKEIWRGSVMIVTQDADSSYDIVPILRLFVQPIDLLPPPPVELKGEQALLPEYVDPIVGLPKLGRRGETLYVRPVEHLEEGRDVSRVDTDEGLFESMRTAPEFDNAPDPPGSFTSRRRRVQVDGERLGKYKDVRGFRLHAERGYTFWRFNIEVELHDRQQRIAYRINRGPSIGFWVPARGQSMNIMFHSCNGFSLSVTPDNFSGPDPMWRDVLNTHQTQPFHVMIGGGDQIYNDKVMSESDIFHEWLNIKNPLHKNNAPFTAEMQNELENFYLERYCMWFSQGLFGLANSQIPMVNMYDDHDIIDGFGSYPDHFMKTPVFSGLGAVAFKYYMLFQQQSVVDETEESEPSLVLGCRPGPYIQELSRSLYMSLGSGLALLAVDARTERTRDEVIRDDTWKKIIDRCYAEIVKGETKHLLVLLGVPIAYPRLVWLENILTSRLMDPIKALGKAGLLGNLLNRFDGGVEVLDDLDDHWTAKNHKDERKYVIEDLQDLAADKSVRITILSGDVHLAAIGQFYSNPKLQVPKHKDFRYMPNVISSAIVNTPPPDIMADILNKRNKVHHFDKDTDEDMIPIFMTGVDGKPRNNKRLLPHRNWCQIRPYVPGSTPPPTPQPDEFEYTPDGTPPGSRGGIFRKLSLTRQRGSKRERDRSHPPPSTRGFLGSLSRRGSLSGSEKRAGNVGRTLSLGRGDKIGPDSEPRVRTGFFSRRTSTDRRRPDDGGINGTWGGDSDSGHNNDDGDGDDYDDENDLYRTRPPPSRRRTQPTAFEGPGGQRGDKLARMGLRGGAGSAREMAEYAAGDDSYFSVTRVPSSSARGAPPITPGAGGGYNNNQHYTHHHGGHYPGAAESPISPPRPFHRTPTGMTGRQLRKRGAAAAAAAAALARLEVDVEGALDVQLNVEVNPRDPAGITVPYRLLVPRLEYEYLGEDPPPGAGEELPSSSDEDEAGLPVDAAEVFGGGRHAAVVLDDDDIAFQHGDAGIEGPRRPPARGGTLKRLFSGGRRRKDSFAGGGSGSTYRDHRSFGDDDYDVI